MTALSIAQVCGDRGIAPGSTKGAAQHLRGIAVGLTALGHHVTTFAARKPQGLYPTPLRPLCDLAHIDDVDVVYERYALGHLAGLEFAQRRRVPFVLEVNAPLLAEATAHRPESVGVDAAAAERRLLREADLVITVSSPLTEWAATHRTGPTITISNGFEPAWFQSESTPPRRPMLVFLGHPKPWHGADRLPSILSGLRQRRRDVDLLVIGGGPGADKLLSEARRLGIDDHLICTGPLPPKEASARLGDATIGLAPYPRHDPFYFSPLKVIDYLAAGLPVVATAQGDIPAVVGDAGILTDPADTAGFIDAIDTLLADPHLACSMGSTGRSRVHETLTWTHAAATTSAALLDLRLATAAP